MINLLLNFRSKHIDIDTDLHKIHIVNCTFYAKPAYGCCIVRSHPNLWTTFCFLNKINFFVHFSERHEYYNYNTDF